MRAAAVAAANGVPPLTDDSHVGHLLREAVGVAAADVNRARDDRLARMTGWWTASYVADYLEGKLSSAPPEL